MFSIVDIEATGGNSKIGRITEIAIYRFDGEEITDHFSSLVNPERPIPEFVQQLTGITDEMASKAPKFTEVAEEVLTITEGTTFVAHNVDFDYSFLQAEFKKTGLLYERPCLCTLALSKILLPNQAAYGLEKLCKALNIEIEDRHRASGDAKATVELFRQLLVASQQKGKHELSLASNDNG